MGRHGVHLEGLLLRSETGVTGACCGSRWRSTQATLATSPRLCGVYVLRMEFLNGISQGFGGGGHRAKMSRTGGMGCRVIIGFVRII